MPSVGPSLPPAQAEKRKRDDEAGDDKTSQSSQSSSSVPVSPSSSSSAKRPRTIGPTLPPPSLDERPSHPLESDAASSSDDDDFGPSLPTASLPKASVSNDELSTVSTAGLQKAAPATTQRDEWMIVPPSSDDWSSRVDPTKLKNRKFNTGKGSKGPGQTVGKESNVNWTETLDEKRARLQREMMGIKDTSISTAKDSPPDHAKARESARKLREYNEKSRGTTLYKEHQKTNPQEKEDDPSTRAFDREKDIAGGMKINQTQRRELMTKAADFGSRFSSGKFL